MYRKCMQCNSQYEPNSSESTYVYAYCSLDCEYLSENGLYIDENEPSEYLKDDMSNL